MMIRVIYIYSVFISLLILVGNATAEVRLSNNLVDDIGRTYGFYLGQGYSLSEISKKYPFLSGSALIAEKEFLACFKSSIDKMDELMIKNSSNEWKEIKESMLKQIALSVNIEQVSEADARQFIDLVRERAKGNIESPIIETLLIFKSDYERNPEREFLDGYKYKYINNGIGKSKGVAFSIESPKTWAAKEGDRPNIVQKFVSENGRGLELFLILINEIQLQPGELVTEMDIAEILTPSGVKEFLPDGAIYIDSGKLTIENLPGFWVRFSINGSRMRNIVSGETVMYTVFYKNKMIQLQGQVTTSVDGKIIERGGLEKYERLFDLIANSLVITNIYK